MAVAGAGRAAWRRARATPGRSSPARAPAPPSRASAPTPGLPSPLRAGSAITTSTAMPGRRPPAPDLAAHDLGRRARRGCGRRRRRPTATSRWRSTRLTDRWRTRRTSRRRRRRRRRRPAPASSGAAPPTAATSSSAACGPDWKNDPIDTRRRCPATSSWSTASARSPCPSGSPRTVARAVGPSGRPARPSATDTRSVGSTPASSRAPAAASASVGWAMRQSGAATTSWVCSARKPARPSAVGGDPDRRAVAAGSTPPPALDDGSATPPVRRSASTTMASRAAALRLDGEVLPAAAAAAGPPGRARRDDPVGRRVDHVDRPAAGPVPLRGRQLDLDGLARQRAAHEHDPTVVVPGDRLATCGEPVGAHAVTRRAPHGGYGGCRRRADRHGTVAGDGPPDPDRPSVLPADFSRLGEEVAGAREGRRRPHPVGRDGRPVRPQPDVRARRHRRQPRPRRRPVRGPPDGADARRAGAALRRGRLPAPDRPRRGLHPPAPHARRDRRARRHAPASRSTRRRRPTPSPTCSTSSTSCS